MATTIETIIDNIIEQATAILEKYSCAIPDGINRINGSIKRRTLDQAVKLLQITDKLCDLNSVNFPEGGVDLMVALDEIYNANTLLIDVD